MKATSDLSENTIVGRLLRLPLDAVPASATVRVVSGPLRGAHWVRGAGIHKCWLGVYERTKAKAFAQWVQRGHVVFDVGANVGFYTLLAARRSGPTGRIAAFEPLPRNVGYLRRHVGLNRLENVEVVEAAVADTPGVMRFGTSRNFLEGHLDAGGELTVATITLDSFVADGFPLPDIVKIDVEGAERRVLHGARDVLAAAQPVIFLATHDDQVHGECCAFLEQHDYSVRSLDADDLSVARELIAVPPDKSGGR